MVIDKEKKKMVAAAYDYAEELARNGKGRKEIHLALTEQGLDAGTAEVVTTKIMQEKAQAVRTAGMHNLVIGGFWCGGGAFVTFVTYAISSGSGAGFYVAAWGAILFGIIKMIRGLFQLMIG